VPKMPPYTDRQGYYSVRERTAFCNIRTIAKMDEKS